ncbi:MAG: glycosyltransferase family 1 protein, partial [Chitinophagaceae bacterium]|nr:glycosyltransferase family 1 protein [Chitinophagaceae bacterium]
MKRLAIITTHPIQYNAPLFQLLAQRENIAIKVFYTWGDTVLKEKYDPGFQKNIEWDIPLLEGYDYAFVEN